MHEVPPGKPLSEGHGPRDAFPRERIAGPGLSPLSL